MNDLKLAFKEVSPIMVVYIFLGLGTGIYLEEMGLSQLNILISSAVLYSGSLSFVLVPLVISGASLGVVALMSLFVSGRHIFYSVASLEKYNIHPFFERIFMGLTLTDQIFSVEANPDYGQGADSIRRLNILVHFIGYAVWVISSMVGAIAGDILPVDLTGIDFSASAFFFIVVIEQFLTFPTRIPIGIGLASAGATLYLLGPDDFILAAMILSIVLLILFRSKIGERLGGGIDG